MSLEESLAKVRVLSSSKIPAQIKQAGLLNAVESALLDDGTSLTPAAYFASLISLLDQTSVLSSALYLLAIISPHVSPGLMSSKLDVLVSKLAPYLADPEADAASVRSCIGVLESALIAQDLGSWHASASEIGPMRVMTGILALAQDSRPKIRKRAVEAVCNILKNPPAGKSEHPATLLAAATAMKAVQDAEETAETVHCLQLIKSIVQSQWPSSRVSPLCEALLRCARTNDQYVVVAALDVFDALFASLDSEAVEASKVQAILSSLNELSPATTDKQLTPAWFAVLAQAYGSYAAVDNEAALEALPDLFTRVKDYLTSVVPEVIESACQCLVAAITLTLTPEAVLNVNRSSKVLKNLATQLFGLLQVKYQLAWAQVCEVFVAFLDSAQWRAPADDAIKVIGALRNDERLSAARDATDSVIAAAIRALGPERVIELVPLQLSVSDHGGAGRAWMLPLLRDNTQHAHLQHFIVYFVPLAEELGEAAQSMQNARNAKIISTVRNQIWNLLPRYCDLPKDTTKALTKEFVGKLMSLLYESPEYRPAICQGLKLLVESNLVYSQGAIQDPLLLAQFSLKDAKQSLDYVAENFGVDILKVILNVFTKTSHDSRGYLLDTINVYLAVIDGEALKEMFNMVSSILAENLDTKTGDSELALTMMDVIIAMAPYLAKESQQAFFNIFMTVSKKSNAPLLQKKAFRTFTRFVDAHEGQIPNLGAVSEFMIELAPLVQPAARRTRLQALLLVVQALPKSDLHFIPTVLSEVILATKDVNEKTREASFELLIVMGQKMAEGGVIDHGKIADLDDDEEVAANLGEYFTMVMAGLLGSTPYMISASITALAYLFYEFKDELDEEQALEVVETVWTFLTSPNREIVKSVLGFVKVSILVLPTEALEPRLSELLESLLGWSKDHKNHFKAKVRHIIERLIRRFPYDTLAQHFPEADMKLLQNVNKSKERAKRKKTTEGSHSNGRGRKFDDELDEALYGSSEDSEEAEEDQKPSRKSADTRQSRKKGNQQYIVTTDEPLDLLDQGAMSHISSSKPQLNAPKKQLKHHLKEKDGKIIIQDEDDGDALSAKSAISAYVDAVRSGPVRTQRGKLKYKRGKRAQDELDDESDDEQTKPAKNKRIAKPKSRLPKRRRF
ncbi:Ribosomal RNA-processing protein 12 [Wickerhamiella sorbophila]|uniref:Ribosomal RNA-processing protein 12 n=1 Tax=Wickerhamiella sorbophila TaxID=45607 RepID=A0A2T0FBU3_9ASCO|nr:Ribosomal RNA-processing protein 12 [Wickerhamiella sorbophila]PRT52437.1 Ribosomal RNA-processing protein 12 [Wickerhamiella sorbophila]